MTLAYDKTGATPVGNSPVPCLQPRQWAPVRDWLLGLDQGVAGCSEGRYIFQSKVS